VPENSVYDANLKKVVELQAVRSHR
jgi:hypothetical protein